MKHNKQAFTLIELLVVVLIIGILASVALPGYQRAVNKSRYAGLKPVTRAIAEAEEAFFMTNGTYDDSADLSNLDIQKPDGTKVSIEFSPTVGHDYVRASYAGLNNRYTQYLKKSSNFAGNIYCEADANDINAQKLCMADGGTDASITRGGYKWYLLQGTSTGEFAYQFTGTTDNLPPKYHFSDGDNELYVTPGGCGMDNFLVGPSQNGGRCYSPDYNPNNPTLTGSVQDLCSTYPFIGGNVPGLEC